MVHQLVDGIVLFSLPFLYTSVCPMNASDFRTFYWAEEGFLP